MTATSALTVDTKCGACSPFGNDDNASGVDTKREPWVRSGNDTIGFIRVRRRHLKGGHPEVRANPRYYRPQATISVSFDLVRAVRVGGKPRHEFVLGLGSQKNIEHNGHCWFWASAVGRMTRHGLHEPQRHRLVAEMIRKGAQVPSVAECEQHMAVWPAHQAALAEVNTAGRRVGDA